MKLRENMTRPYGFPTLRTIEKQALMRFTARRSPIKTSQPSRSGSL
jgi:hypothetical protein